MRTLLIALSIALLTPASWAQAPSTPHPPGRDFGAGLTLADVTPLAEAAQKSEGSAVVLLRGRLLEVCQAKGCWTVLRDETAQARVRFKDYGFFLPTDSAGSEAYVEGVAQVVTLSRDDARHYEAETPGGDPDAIRGPVRELSVTATGVRLLPRE